MKSSVFAAGVSCAIATTLLSEENIKKLSPNSMPDYSSKIADSLGTTMNNNLGGHLISSNDETNGRALRSSLLQTNPATAVSMINLLGNSGFGADGPTNFLGDSTGIESLASLSQGAMDLSPFAKANTDMLQDVIKTSHRFASMDVLGQKSMDAENFVDPNTVNTIQEDVIDQEENFEAVSAEVDDVDVDPSPADTIVLKKSSEVENADSHFSTLRSGAVATSVFGAAAAGVLAMLMQ